MNIERIISQWVTDYACFIERPLERSGIVCLLLFCPLMATIVDGLRSLLILWRHAMIDG
jgi:hypothetical protein